MLQIISGCTAIISTVVFIVCIMVSNMPKQVRIGDRFAHFNPGITMNPNEEDRPWVGIKEVKKIRDGKALVAWKTIDVDGVTRIYEAWSNLFGIGRFDERLPSKAGTQNKN